MDIADKIKALPDNEIVCIVKNLSAFGFTIEQSNVLSIPDLKAYVEQYEALEDQCLAMMTYLTFCQLGMDEFQEVCLLADIDEQVTMGWRTHCTSGELRSGVEREDYKQYRFGFIDGYPAGRASVKKQYEALLAAAKDAVAFRGEQYRDELLAAIVACEEKDG